MAVLRKTYYAYLFIKCLLTLLILRIGNSKLILVDFDFTLVNNHFDTERLEYKKEKLIFNSVVLQILEKKYDFFPVIFTARSGRTIKYIKDYTEWKSYFNFILCCGITHSKYSIAYFAASIFTSVIWIDDLSDVNFVTGKKVVYKDPKVIENLCFIRW